MNKPQSFALAPGFLSENARPPGEILAEELEARGMSQKALAEAMGRSPRVVSDIIRAKKGITAETALQLEAALGVSAVFWLNHQVRYDLACARRAARAKG